MLMCIDIGNTDISFVLFEKENIKIAFRIHTNNKKTCDEYEIDIKNILGSNHVSFNDIEGVSIASVVPKVTASIIEMFNHYPQIKLVNLGFGVKTGLKIKADNPKEVGADIIASVVAAKERHQMDTFVVDLGTATTITYLSKEGVMEGVVIIPGVMSMLKSLTDNTSLLPSVHIKVPSTVLGNNTSHCMQSGITYGQASMIEGIIERIEKEKDLQNSKILLTGGFSSMIGEIINREVEVVDNLLLEGLRIIYNKNS